MKTSHLAVMVFSLHESTEDTHWSICPVGLSVDSCFTAYRRTQVRSTLCPHLCGLRLQVWTFAAKCSQSRLCFLMDQKVAGSVIWEVMWSEPESKSADKLAKLAGWILSFPPRSPSFIRAPAERRIVSCQYLIINFHQHCASRMDRLASRVVTPGTGFNGPLETETGSVCLQWHFLLHMLT